VVEAGGAQWLERVVLRRCPLPPAEPFTLSPSPHLAQQLALGQQGGDVLGQDDVAVKGGEEGRESVRAVKKKGKRAGRRNGAHEEKRARALVSFHVQPLHLPVLVDVVIVLLGVLKKKGEGEKGG